MFTVGDVIDEKYVVLDKIGEGGFGAVFHVSDGHGDEFALKICVDTAPEQRRRFAREVRVMARIDHHNVVKVVGSNVDHDPPYFVMPLAVGSVSAELVWMSHDEEAAIAAIKAIAYGVQAIHAIGATHRDIKPLNALRLTDGSLAVSDLGLAKFNDRDTTILTRTTGNLGTFAYAAPEQFQPGGTRDADARTDVYQLGKTLYELLTGELPHMMDFKKVDPGLVHIIQRATRHDAADRYQSVQEFLDAIKNYELTKNPDAHPTAAFDKLLGDATSLLEQKNQYDPAALIRMVTVMLRHVDDAKLVIERFERIPENLISVLASDHPAEAETLVRAYRDAVDAAMGRYSFEHAEIVATKMRLVFNAAATTALKVLSIETTLAAAVALNRWAAMEVFDSMLMAVMSSADAVAVADMLTARIGDYRVVADRVAGGKLHAAIRRIRAIATGESDESELSHIARRE